MTRPIDPEGKRALFSHGTTQHGATHDGSGKAALYSTARRRPGTLVLECSRCHGRTRVGYAEFARRHLPAWLWLPWREHSRLMLCPACERRTWVAAHWFA